MRSAVTPTSWTGGSARARSATSAVRSSDHLIVDVEQAAQEVRTGSEIAFIPSYGSLLAATTSPYVQKVVLRG
jgi:predicted amino acid racemase